MSFNDLPIEIIANIFHTHVYVHLGLRKTLLLTCRRWHAVATNLGSLWRNISWCTSTAPPRTVQCRSLTDLACIIKRTGQATFELTLGHWDGLPSYQEIEDFVASIDPNWLSRCHKLTITLSNKWMYDDKIHLLKRIFLGSTFNALEGFAWGYPFDSATELKLNTLLHHFDTSAPLLWDLTLDCVPNFPLHFPALLGRIRKLKNTQKMLSPAISNKFANVEHLDLIHQSGPCSNLVAPRLTSLCLQGRFPPTIWPPRETLQRLTHLVLRFFDTGEHSTSLSLPSLKYLGAHFSGLRSFHGVINAENLEELALVNFVVDGSPKISLGMNTAPSIVQLYLRPSTSFEVALQPPSVWEKMEELHLTVFDAIGYIPLTVARALVTANFAPLLRCFTVRYANTNIKADPSQAQKQTWVQGLSDIMYNRVLAGVARPKELKVGWFHNYVSFYNLGQDCEKWWVTEWTDCS